MEKTTTRLMICRSAFARAISAQASIAHFRWPSSSYNPSVSRLRRLVMLDSQWFAVAGTGRKWNSRCVTNASFPSSTYTVLHDIWITVRPNGLVDCI